VPVIIESRVTAAEIPNEAVRAAEALVAATIS
jgi:hypothetical protein